MEFRIADTFTDSLENHDYAFHAMFQRGFTPVQAARQWDKEMKCPS